jgi:hypothetical protein
MRRCLHLTHKAFFCMENNRKLVPLVKTHKKVRGMMGWEFSLDLLMDTHSLLQSLHQQKWLLRIVLAKRIMKWWVPIKLMNSCLVMHKSPLLTQSFCTPHDDLCRYNFKWSFPVKKEEAIQATEGNTRPYTKNHETMMITPMDHHVHVHSWDTRGNQGITWSRFKGGV